MDFIRSIMGSVPGLLRDSGLCLGPVIAVSTTSLAVILGLMFILARRKWSHPCRDYNDSKCQKLLRSLKTITDKHSLGIKETHPAAAYPLLEPASDKGSGSKIDNARMLQNENTKLEDRFRSLDRLTYNIRKARLSLVQAKQTPDSEATSGKPNIKWLDEIIKEAESVKVMLRNSAVPLDNHGSEQGAMITDSSAHDTVEGECDHGDLTVEKIDAVSVAGLEMLELLLLTAQILSSD